MRRTSGRHRSDVPVATITQQVRAGSARPPDSPVREGVCPALPRLRLADAFANTLANTLADSLAYALTPALVDALVGGPGIV